MIEPTLVTYSLLAEKPRAYASEAVGELHESNVVTEVVLSAKT